MVQTVKFLVVPLILVTIVVGGLFVFRQEVTHWLFRPTSSVLPRQDISLDNAQDAAEQTVELVAEDLDIPWEVAFLPDSTLLVTERSGSLLHSISTTRTAIPIEGVVHRGEGGLLGMALHPKFAENNWLYLYLTTQTDTGLLNRVERYTFDTQKNILSQRTVLLQNIPGAANHDGGRLAFGPDGKLYITTGDAENSQLAQNKTSLAGKILRLNDDGSIPQDNPFGTAIYSYGHRNPQGIAWDSEGQLWATEHGPSGIGSGYDEVNLITKGGNYGWPEIQGDETAQGMIAPVLQSGGSETWAPAGLAIYGDSVFFSGLRGESLYSARIDASTLSELQAHFREQYGRLRIVTVSPDGWLYFGTSNTDGRGQATVGDDKIFRLRLSY